DMFAFGAVLYEMVAGRPPFTGESHASLIAEIISSDPAPLATSQPLAPPLLDAIVRKCLAKAPEDRWQDARDLEAALRWVRESTPLAARNSATASWRVFAALIAGAVVLATGAALMLRRHTAAAPHVVRFSLALPDKTVA